MAIILGDDNDNTLYGTPSADLIYGFGGNDILFGSDPLSNIPQDGDDLSLGARGMTGSHPG
jgi:Ca2+-binding RTX toxin-like protein